MDLSQENFKIIVFILIKYYINIILFISRYNKNITLLSNLAVVDLGVTREKGQLQWGRGCGIFSPSVYLGGLF